MSNTVVLRLASAAVLALMAGSVMSSPASAFVGLSDKQADEVSEFIKCQTFLLKADLELFEADPDCGHGPHVLDLKSLGSQLGGGSPEKERDDCYPSGGVVTILSEGGYGDDEYCYPSRPE